MTGSPRVLSNGEFAALLAWAVEKTDDNAALSELMSIYEPDVRRAASVLLGKDLRSSFDANDLVQSVHLRLIIHIRGGKLTPSSPAQLRAAALTLLRQNVIQHWRRRRCQVRHATAMATRNRLTDGNDLTASEEFDPAKMVAYQDFLEWVGRRLREDERRIVVMRLEGYRTHEIAAELGIATGVLRVRLSRLRKRLLLEMPPNGWS